MKKAPDSFSGSLRLLVVEDSEDDALLQMRLLRRAGMEVTHERVETAADLRAALARGPWNAVIADYNLPGFSGLEALGIVRAAHPDLPFLLVSGSVGEELAVAAMKAGANDHVTKRQLGRLPPALARELAEADARAAHRQALRSLEASEARLRAIIENEPECVKVVDTAGRLVDMNPAGLAMLEADSLAHAQSRPLAEFLASEHRRSFQELHRRVIGGESGLLEFEVTGLRGTRRWLETHAAPLAAADGTVQLIGITRDMTERRRAEERLRESEARFRSLSTLAADWYWEQDENFRFVSIEEQEVRAVSAHAIGRTRWEAAGADLAEPKWAEHRATLERHLPFRDFQYGRRSLDGVWRHVSVSGLPIFDAAGRFRGYRGVGRDVTEKRAAEARIEYLARVYAVLSGVSGALLRATSRPELFEQACRIAVDAGRFRMAWVGLVDAAGAAVRPAASAGDLRGFLDAAPLALVETRPGARNLVARAVREQRALVSNDIEGDPERIMKAELRARGIRSVAVLPLVVEARAIGVLVLYAGEAGFFDEEEMRLLVELAADISFAIEHIEIAERLEYLAYHDALTGLANRTLFAERLEAHLGEARRAGRLLGLSLVDIERFKAVNDALGRGSGDELLRQVAARLRTAAGDDGRLARLGNDLFAVMTYDAESADDMARRTERRMREIFGPPFHAGGAELRVAARLGIAFFPGDGASAEELLTNAEAALKKAKAAGERYLFYAPQMSARVAERLALESRLRRAVEHGGLVLHYQPKVEARTGALCGMEALLRWRDEDRLVPPAEFVPLLEETGLILEAGAWALERAALDHRAWAEAGLVPPRVAVNVSPIQLRQRDFVERVARAIAAGSPAGIDLEITESLIMADIGESNAKLRAVRALGLRIAIDDFGTGYSSLAYLARLPVQALKIDRSFIVTMLEEPQTLTLVTTIVSLAHSLRLAVIAEGVDAEMQAAALRGMGCDELQGFLFHRPLPFEEMTALLRRERGC